MLPSYLLALREGIEAALIVGIVLGALRQIHRTDLNGAVWSGVLSAAALSTIAAILLQAFGTALEGTAEQIFEGITMLLAAGVLTWMIFWMARQARSLRHSLEAEVRLASLAGGQRGLFLLAFLAVAREGVELALFLTAAAFASSAEQMLLGALLGLGTAALLGWSLFTSLVKLDLRRFFAATGVLLVLFAAGLVAHGVHELNEAGWIPAIIEHVWDITPLLNEKSTLGELLKALFGYNANPSLTEVLAYVGYYAAIFFGLHRQRKVEALLREA